MSSKTSTQATAYVLSLPPALQTAVRADSLPPLDSDDAITLLVRQTTARRKNDYMDRIMPHPPAISPLECRLYDQVYRVLTNY